MKQKNQKRRFLGKTEGFKSKEERSFYNKMLKAYLDGKEFFHFGKELRCLPKYYVVEQEYVN